MRKGKFIVFEGLDGSGKSTQIENLKAKLRTENIRCHFTREPSDSIPGGLIRSAMKKKTTFHNDTSALLFLADRIEHVTKDIIPLLEEGIHVVSDRYYYSNIAYQGLSSDMNMLYTLNELLIMNKLRPDYTIFLNVSLEESLKRISQDRVQTDLYEEKDLLLRIREHFFQTFERMKDKENIITINADGDAESTFEKIWEALSPAFFEKDE